MRFPWWLPFGSVPEVEPTALSRELSRRAAPQLIDVRSRAEWTNGHIPGSLNVSISELQKPFGALHLDRERAVVAICLSGHRSVPAVRLLARHGFPTVRQLAGGMLAWRRAGLPEIRGAH